MPSDEELPWDATLFLPREHDLDSLREAAAHCEACDLYRTGTQTVFGEGLRQADVMFIGEQPGDQEDRAGQPFVGPAGRVLDEALEEVGIDRSNVYVTNVVKHFKWVARGKRRIHSKPNAREIRACLPWLNAELAVVKPRVVVLLGATAAQALMGASFRVTQQRGKPIEGGTLAPFVVATVHPASILRAPDDESRAAEGQAFIDDLRAVRKLLDEPSG
ncbi:MAG TPA: UdgX family uracil-DNA binding protein [Chloroflexota bacterium]|jgi:DNA polymerase|nr:UdgX family uracil-DNA binding protein [Chloroflexota bacterium]